MSLGENWRGWGGLLVAPRAPPAEPFPFPPKSGGMGPPGAQPWGSPGAGSSIHPLCACLTLLCAPWNRPPKHGGHLKGQKAKDKLPVGGPPDLGALAGPPGADGMAKLKGRECRLPLTLAKCLLGLQAPDSGLGAAGLSCDSLPSPLGPPYGRAPWLGTGEHSAPFPLTPCYQAGLEEMP